MIGISACLCGINCRYDGGNSLDETLMKRLDRREMIAVCPEMLGGLPVPRTPARIIGGTGYDVLDGAAAVINADGRDVTGFFIKGAFTALEILARAFVRQCYVKHKSPSCGFAGEGGIIGVCSALLNREGTDLIEISSKSRMPK